ncbi:unnamed protein product [Alopecurus aequalis]
MVQPHLATQMEALGVELQAMFATRLEELFQPLRDLVATVEGWTEKVSSMWELMEALGGRLARVSEAVGADFLSELAMVDSDIALPAMEVQGVKEQSQGDQVVASCKGFELVEVALPDTTSGEVLVELSALSDPLILEASEPGVSLGGDGLPSGPASPTLLDELLSNFSCTAPLSLLDAPIQLQIEGDSSYAGRRSGRLEKKNKDCSIPAAKRAEYRLAEAFGDVPKEKISKKHSEEEVQEKMKPYLKMCKKPVTPVIMQAVRELVQANV